MRAWVAAFIGAGIADRLWHGLEPLEERTLLSGITLITHGFASDVTSWVDTMRQAIIVRPELAGSDLTTYTAVVQDPGALGGPLDVTLGPRIGPDPTASNSGEIILLLYWSDVEGYFSFGND